MLKIYNFQNIENPYLNCLLDLYWSHKSKNLKKLMPISPHIQEFKTKIKKKIKKSKSKK
jgi:hypothetical protein